MAYSPEAASYVDLTYARLSREIAAKVAIGRMGEELLLQGQRAVPARALATGFRFSYPHLEDCLRHQLGRWEEPKQTGAPA